MVSAPQRKSRADEAECAHHIRVGPAFACLSVCARTNWHIMGKAQKGFLPVSRCGQE